MQRIPLSSHRTVQTFLSLVIFKTTALYAPLSFVLSITDYQTCNIVSRSLSNESYVGLDHLQEAKVSRFTYPEIAVLFNWYFSSAFFLTKAEKRAFSHTKIYIANKAQYIYLYTVDKIPYFRVSQEKKALEKNPQSITGVMHLNFFAKSFFIRN